MSSAESATGADREHIKLRELILYISDKSQTHRNFGATKLNKILFFADYVAFARRGIAITGETYFKLPKGPAPKYFKVASAQMQEAGELVMREQTYFTRMQKRPVALRQADLSHFEAWEIALVDEIVDLLRDMNASEVSELSHQCLGWNLVGEREDIPYETVFIRDPRGIIITERRKKRAEEIAVRYGLS